MRGLAGVLYIAGGAALAWVMCPANAVVPPVALEFSTIEQPAPQRRAARILYAYVTGYNTLVAQTDNEPCIAATGDNICGRRNVVACPRSLELGTVVEIHGKAYLCEDRTARKFDGRFDISCDKDKTCPMQVAGWATIKVLDD